MPDMTLKIQAITNDPLRKIALITLTDVLEDHPQISATMKLTSLESQTLSEVHDAVKAQAKALFAEAIERLNRFHGL
jgi:hypothetical protein